MNWIIVPKAKAITTERSMPEIIASALAELIYVLRSAGASGEFEIFMREIATAAPSNSKTIETVVEVGNPNVLNASRRMTSVIMTARKMIMISEK